MIHIEISRQELEKRIDDLSPTWRKRAEERRQAVLAGTLHVGEKDAIWSEVKFVFVELQCYKCIYCERPLAKTKTGSPEKVLVEYDVEHFRPKNRVTLWPTPADLARRPSLGYSAPVHSGASGGYPHLAFEIGNYIVSCKPCNSSYKLDRFPISGVAGAMPDEISKLDAMEGPFLIFPFGERGEDPARFLEFFGALVRVKPPAGADRFRARVVIDFFELDTREDLLELRCAVIRELWPHLEGRRNEDVGERQIAEDFVTTFRSENRIPVAACARAFIDLYETDRPSAKRWYLAASNYAISKDPAVFGTL